MGPELSMNISAFAWCNCSSSVLVDTPSCNVIETVARDFEKSGAYVRSSQRNHLNRPTEISEIINVQINFDIKKHFDRISAIIVSNLFCHIWAWFELISFDSVCPFCFLLNTAQTNFVNMSLSLYPSQTRHVLKLVHIISKLFWRKLKVMTNSWL